MSVTTQTPHSNPFQHDCSDYTITVHSDTYNNIPQVHVSDSYNAVFGCFHLKKKKVCFVTAFHVVKKKKGCTQMTQH